MTPLEKTLKTKLQVALTKERLYTSPVVNTMSGRTSLHPTGRTFAIQGLDAVLFFALAEHYRITAVNNYLGSGKNAFFHKALYGPFRKEAIPSETTGILQVITALNDAVGPSLIRSVFENTIRWVDTYIEILDFIPTLVTFITKADPKKIQEKFLGPRVARVLLFMLALLKERQPDRYARALNTFLREKGLEDRLVAGFSLNDANVVTPIAPEKMNEIIETLQSLDKFIKNYTKNVSLSIPPPPQRASYIPRRR